MNPQGWKTYVAAAAAILTGIAALTQGHYAEGASGVIGGFALIGVRGAFAKVIEAILSRKTAPVIAFIGGLLLLGLFTAQPARAQTTELSIGPSIVRVNPHFTRKDFKFNQSTDQVGADISLSHYFKDRNVGFTVDLGFTAKGTNATDSSLGTVAIGPAWKYQNHRVEPFVRVLFGVSRLAATNQQLKFDKSNAGFAVVAGGGVDVALSKRFALRVVQVDYLGTRILGSTVNHARASAGVVVRF